MGAWGVGNFENDDALDWIYDLKSSNDKKLIIKALRNIDDNSEYLEAPDCSEALSAIEIVAAKHSNNMSGLSDDLIEWVNKKHGLFKKTITFTSDDISVSRSVLNKIINDSELKELWEETDDFDAWKKVQKNLLEKLG